MSFRLILNVLLLLFFCSWQIKRCFYFFLFAYALLNLASIAWFSDTKRPVLFSTGLFLLVLSGLNQPVVAVVTAVDHIDQPCLHI